MTNEELVAAIRNGRKDLIINLWDQTRNVIAKQANVFFAKLNGLGGIDAEDLLQTGFLAMVDAVEYYDPGRGANFLTALNYSLLNHFSEAAGLRTEHARSDPLQSALSLEYEYDDGASLLDMQANPQDVIENAEARMQNDQLRECLEEALDAIPPNDADAIRAKYFKGQTLQQAAREQGVSEARIRQRQVHGMRQLRKLSKKYHLDKFIDLQTPFYMRTNFEASQTSPTEAIFFYRERLRGADKK